MAAINDHGERLARLALAKLPKGTWTAFDFVDNDGVDLDRPIKMNVTVTITDDEMVVDWTGSDRDVRGPINLPLGMTEAFCALIFKSLTTPDSPVVAGNFRPLRVVTEPGSVMHAVPPMPTFTMWTGLLGGEVILKALAQGMPDLVPACSGGDVCSMMGLGHQPAQRRGLAGGHQRGGRLRRPRRRRRRGRDHAPVRAGLPQQPGRGARDQVVDVHRVLRLPPGHRRRGA